MKNMIKKLVTIHCPPHFSSLISPPSSLISHFSFLFLSLALALPAVAHTVSFNMRGHGTQVPPQTVADGGYVVEPPAPVDAADEYTFQGWYPESQCINKWDFKTEQVTSDMTLYAGWAKLPTTPKRPSEDGWSTPASYNGSLSSGLRVVVPSNKEDLFIGNDYLELGMHKNGAFGSYNTTPTTFHRWSGHNNLGLRVSKSGWGTGDDPNGTYTRDFFLPGAIDEGWLITVDGADAMSGQYAANRYGGGTSMRGINLTGSPALSMKVVGTPGADKETLSVKTVVDSTVNLQVEQVVTFSKVDTGYDTWVTIRNTSDADKANVCYYRAFDPDQSADFDTDNFYHTEPNGDVFVLASAVNSGLPSPTTLSNMFAKADGAFFFWAPVLDFGYTVTPMTQSVGWSSGSGFSAPAEGYHKYEDTGMSIRINLGTIPAHGEKTLYYYSSLDPVASRAMEKLIQKQGKEVPSPVFTSDNVKDEVIWYEPGDTYAPATLASTGDKSGRIYLVVRECASLAELSTASNQLVRGAACDASGAVAFATIPAVQRGPLYAYYVDDDGNISKPLEFYVAPYEIFTLKFDANGGRFADGTTVTNVPYTRWTRTEEPSFKPTHDWSCCIGWASNATGTVDFKFGERLSAETTAYAKWSAPITLVANNAPYTGAPYDRAQLSGDKSAWAAAGRPLPTISYEGRDGTSYGPSVTAPTEAGSYTAKAVSGSSTSSVDFDIMRITIGAGEQVGSFIKAPVKIDGSMTIYSVVPNGTTLRLTQVTGTGWSFKNGVIDKSSSHATPVVNQDYISVQLVIDPAAATATRTVAAMAEEAFSFVRYGKKVAEVKISGTYAAGITLKGSDAYLDGHFYTVSTSTFTWAKAMEWAFNLMTTESTRYPGFRSYPATITSGEENKILVSAYNSGSGEKRIWLGGVPRTLASGGVTVTGPEGNRTVTVSSWPKSTQPSGYTSYFVRTSDNTTGAGELYTWLAETPEGASGVSAPEEHNASGVNGACWHSGEPNGGYPFCFGWEGALWDDLANDDYMRSIAEWEPIDPEAIITVSDTAKMVLATFNAGATGVTCGGAPFETTNMVRRVGSVASVPALVCEDLMLVGWSNGGLTTKTSEEVAAIDPAIGSAAETWTAVWLAAVRIPVFVALDGLGVVPQDGRTYEFSITNGSVTTPLQPCCTNLILACPAGTGDVYRVGFATNDVTNPWSLALGNGTYIYDIRQKTVARPGEQLAEGTWRTCVKVDMSTKPYVTLTNNEYLDAIDDLSEGAFKSFKSSGEASFSSEERYIVLGSDTQTVTWGGNFNRALVKSKFAFDFSRSFRVDGTMQVGNAADGTAIGFVPNGQDLNTSSDFSGEGSALGCYRCSKNGNGLFLEFDTLGDGWSWGGQTDYIGNTAHFVLTTTSASGEPSNVKGQNVVFGDNYALPSEVMNYSIDYDSFSKEMLFTIKTTTKTWKLAYTNPPAVFNSMRAYMTLSGAMRYGGNNEYGCGAAGSPAPKTKITIATFNYVNDSMTGAVENTFRNRQEALVTYDANGGEIVSGIERTSAFANAGRYSCPVDPERKDYGFLGWYTSWTNGTDTVEAKRGEKLSPIADCTVYAKWASRAIDPGEGDKTLKTSPAVDEDGNPIPGVAAVDCATNELKQTDFAIPEMTDNGTGAGAKPIVQIKEYSFCAEKYDRQHPGKELTSVTIPTYVREIQPFAFESCTKLTNVTFSVTRDYETREKVSLLIDDWAFTESSISNLVFPADSKVILGKNCFSDAKNLANIYILGEVEVEGQYPFRNIGKNLSAGTKVKVHLSPTLAADAKYVYSLTNGMDYAHVEIDQGIEGKASIAEGPTFAGDDVSFKFSVESDSPWLKVTENTVYLFWSTTADPKTFIGNEAKHPKTLVDNGDGTWTATFDKPASSGSTLMFFQLCIGAER